ncbi:alpha/beta hydrolase [Streptomyces spectabilis]|uniref:alpha/beta fold hydrolase n=1 Tax=Streptomyces spectabilis TaxID=68270 RepID=UPI0033FCC9DA
MTETIAGTPTHTVMVGGDRVAYRMFGPEGTRPLVLLNRFRAGLDDWDPLLLAHLARERQVVVFDSAGIGYSEGRARASIDGMATVASGFIDSLGPGQVDLLGFSMGGYVAQRLAIEHPHQVRRVILVGTGPGGGEGIEPPEPVVGKLVAQRDVTLDALHTLFFPPTPAGRKAAEDYWHRTHTEARGPRADVTPEAGAAQREAIVAWTSGTRSAFPQLDKITHPVLVVNGDHDVMVPTHNSYVMAQRLPHAQLIIYPNAGHASLFQYPENFAAHAERFLSATDELPLA